MAALSNDLSGVDAAMTNLSIQIPAVASKSTTLNVCNLRRMYWIRLIFFVITGREAIVSTQRYGTIDARL